MNGGFYTEQEHAKLGTMEAMRDARLEENKGAYMNS